MQNPQYPSSGNQTPPSASHHGKATALLRLTREFASNFLIKLKLIT